MKLVIDRQKWYRGQGSKESALMRKDGRQCCVGILASAVGVTNFGCRETKEFAITVSQLEAEEGAKVWNVWNGEFDMAYAINDRPVGERVKELRMSSETTREELIAEEFAKHGIEVEFVG